MTRMVIVEKSSTFPGSTFYIVCRLKTEVLWFIDLVKVMEKAYRNGDTCRAENNSLVLTARAEIMQN